MPTECIQDSFAFGRVEGRAVVADFGGGTITSDAGALLLWKTDSAVRLIDRWMQWVLFGKRSGVNCHYLNSRNRNPQLGRAQMRAGLLCHDLASAALGQVFAAREQRAHLVGE